MAKVGFWLQGATGKLAGSKLQKGVNGTVIANNMNKPKNPNTVNQVIQRVFVNTVAQAYSEMRELCSHSFQGVTEGAKSMARFQSLNLNYFRTRAADLGEEQLSAYINFVPVGQKGIRPAAFIISEGKLPRVACGINAEFAAYMPLDANTYQAVLDKYDLQRGDQLTFVAIEENTEFAGTYSAKYARVILDPRESDGSQAPLSTAFIDANSINKANSKNAGDFGLLEFGASGMVFSMRAGAKVCAVGIIVSREEGDEWLRSSCQMIVSEAAIGNEGISLSHAIRLSTEGTKINVTDGNAYLNNAGVSGTQGSAGSGSSEQEIEDAPATYSNSVSFTANGATSDQNVAGGSVNLTEPVTSVVVRGTNLNADTLVAFEASAATQTGSWQYNDAGTLATFTPENGSMAAGTTVRIMKRPSGDGEFATFFTLNAVAAGGGNEGGSPID